MPPTIETEKPLYSASGEPEGGNQTQIFDSGNLQGVARMQQSPRSVRGSGVELLVSVEVKTTSFGSVSTVGNIYFAGFCGARGSVDRDKLIIRSWAGKGGMRGGTADYG